MKQIVIHTEDITSDVMEIRVFKDKVFFDVMVDQCGTTFKISKEELRGMIND